jgi:hypothetical protein
MKRGISIDRKAMPKAAAAYLTTFHAWLLVLLLASPVAVKAQLRYLTNNGTIIITGYTGSGGAVDIPDAVNGQPVTGILGEAFLDNLNVTSVTIGHSVTNIGSVTFAQCINLTNVTIPDSVTSIGFEAFAGCTSLASITIPGSVTSIELDTFLYCTSLNRVTMGNGIINIESSAFDTCTKLTSMTIPKSVANIEFEAFADCTSLREVYFSGNAPTYIDSTAFAGDINATVYYLPGTTGWNATCAGLPTALWNPQVQTEDSSFGVTTNRFGLNILGK